MKCLANHVWEPDIENWECPVCGSDSRYFYIDESDPYATDECTKLHAKDIIVCTKCDRTWTGSRLSKIYQIVNDMIECPHCNGKGMVKRTDELKEKK